MSVDIRNRSREQPVCLSMSAAKELVLKEPSVVAFDRIPECNQSDRGRSRD